MAAQPSASQPLSYRPAGALNAATALQPYAGPWNRRLAAHLLRRAGFGGTPADVDRTAAMSPHDAVDALIRFADAPAGGPYPQLEVFQPGMTALNGAGLGGRRRRALQAPMPMQAAQGETPMSAGQPMQGAADDATAERRKELAKARNRVRRDNLIALQSWWLERMIAAQSPLQEKMTLFWHGHFTSSPEKGTTGQELFMQNQLFRQYALGNVRDLTLHVSQDPAMLRYLDNNVNVKSHPNENYARELMELFTLGIGNYTEADVRESARAFTGWTFRRQPDGSGTFYDNARQHDDGTKTFLGRSGNFAGNDVVGIIFEQPAAARFFANRLLSFFVYADPEPALVDQVAALLVRNRWEMRPVMSALLRSNVFFSDRAYRALVKSPVEFVVGTHQVFNIPQVSPVELATLKQMGQVLFYPPNVKGWDGGAAWLNSQTVLTRENFANGISANPTMFGDAPWMAQAKQDRDPRVVAALLTGVMLQNDVSPASNAQLVAYLSGSGQAALPQLSTENADDRVRGAAYLTMAMPAYQLA